MTALWLLSSVYVLAGCVAFEVTDRGHGLRRNIRDASGGHPGLVWVFSACLIIVLKG